MVGADQRDVQRLRADAGEDADSEFRLGMDDIQLQAADLGERVQMERRGHDIAVQGLQFHAGQPQNAAVAVPFRHAAAGPGRDDIDLLAVALQLIAQNAGAAGDAVGFRRKGIREQSDSHSLSSFSSSSSAGCAVLAAAGISTSGRDLA